MKKIVLIGTFRSGKSTLLDLLQRDNMLNWKFIPEVARPLLEANPELESSPYFQDILFAEQMRLETTEGINSNIVCDRGAIDIVTYATHFRQQVKPEWESWTRTYDSIFLLDKNNIPFDAAIIDSDPQYAPGRDWIAFRDSIHLEMLATLRRLNLSYELLSGTVEERLVRLKRELQVFTSKEGQFLSPGRKEGGF